MKAFSRWEIAVEGMIVLMKGTGNQMVEAELQRRLSRVRVGDEAPATFGKYLRPKQRY
jgi:hypothetical protein